ncbi:hypothetical protein HYV79_04035 [Candidatus Woesearchaeota archaeon]|nr:hypothetical protein [Candidatus Woesearchaeota archaeon]
MDKKVLIRKKRKKLSNFFLGIGLAFGFSGCTIPIKNHNHLNSEEKKVLEEKLKNVDWNCYRDKTIKKYSLSNEKYNEERLFYLYLDFLSIISNEKYSNKNFHIFKRNNASVFDLIKDGFDPLFLSERTGGIYLSPKIYVSQDKEHLFSSITHEFGHHTDHSLSYMKYILSKKSRICREASAESFSLYVASELNIRKNYSFSHNLANYFFYIKKYCDNFDELLYKDQYLAANQVIAIVSSEKETAFDVWMFLRNNNEQVIWNYCKNIVKNKGMTDAVEEGRLNINHWFTKL